MQGCTRPPSSPRPGAVTWWLTEASDVSAHEYQSGWVIHRKRSPDWLISSAFTPNRAWGRRAVTAGRCGHDVTRIGKPGDRPAGREVGEGAAKQLGELEPLSGSKAGSPGQEHSQPKRCKELSLCSLLGGQWPVRMCRQTPGIQLTSATESPSDHPVTTETQAYSPPRPLATVMGLVLTPREVGCQQAAPLLLLKEDGTAL